MSHLQVWNRHEELWYSTLRESLGASKKRELITGNWEFKDPSSQALPIRATNSDLCQCKWMWKELQGINLESISFSIISVGESHCYASWAIQACCYGACDCLWRWSNLHKMWLNLVGWHFPVHRDSMESTQNCHATVFVLSNGCWWILMQLLPLHGMLLFDKDGLYQHESMNPRISHAVFPDLKNVSSESVANQMTKLIHKHSDPALKECNQSWSIHVGSNTTLAAHPDITPEEQQNAGSFTSGYNMDLYTGMNPKLRMMAANALASHKMPKKPCLLQLACGPICP